MLSINTVEWAFLFKSQPNETLHSPRSPVRTLGNTQSKYPQHLKLSALKRTVFTK